MSLPVFLNLFQGQVNLLLMICVGEFLRKMMDYKPFQAGLWLGGLLLKPQLLILIIPALLLKRLRLTIYGFAVSSFGVGMISLLLGGLNGFLKVVQLWIGYIGGLPSNYPEAMMNWRMIALNVNALSNSNIGWWIAIPCLVATFLYALYGWKFHFNNHSSQFALAILGIFAATFALSWHSHFSMTMITIPILLFLISRQILPEHLFSFWFFMPLTLMLIIYIIASLIKGGLLPTDFYPVLNLLSGLRGLILNVFLLWWAIRNLKRDSPQNIIIT